MILALAGGIGGSKLVLGLYHTLPAGELTILANTGDDIEILGLRICPDLDTLTYTLSGRVNAETGWGAQSDSFACLRVLGELGEQTWFNLGDRDLALHIWRTYQLRLGVKLTEITRRVSAAFGLSCRVLPMTDEFAPTFVVTEGGDLHLQEYLVRDACRPVVRGFRYAAAGTDPPGELTEILPKLDAVVICPSNPFISIEPILTVTGMRKLLRDLPCPVIAVSPIVGGKAIKGPAAQMLQQLDLPVSAQTVAERYADLCDIFVLDDQDAALADAIEDLGLRVCVTDTLMVSNEDKLRLARKVLELV